LIYNIIMKYHIKIYKMSLLSKHKFNYKLCKLMKINIDSNLDRISMFKKVYKYMIRNSLIVRDEKNKYFLLNSELADALNADEGFPYNMTDIIKLIKLSIIEDIYEL